MLFILIILIQIIVPLKSIYHNDYESRVFDYLPSNCFDCLSYRDIILTELNDVPARTFANFHLGSRDTSLILNGQVNLILHPYAFQSLIVRKPNKTLTITLTAPNSWLNITENTFHGLELHAYSTLRIVIKFFYGCTFHKNSLSGIEMDRTSRLIVDISSVTEVIFDDQIFENHGWNSSVEFLISRTETIVFHSYSFSQLIIPSHAMISFHFELISQISFKSFSFSSLQLSSSSSFRFYAIFLNRLLIDSYAFDHLQFDSNAQFNFTIRTLGTCLCLKSFAFNHLQSKLNSKNTLILFDLYTLRGLSFLSHTFANLSLNHPSNQLKIILSNPLNDPNPIVNFENETFSSTTSSGLITMNFSEVIIVRFESNSLAFDSFIHQITFKDISLIDLSTLEYQQTKKKFTLVFDNIQFIQWPTEFINTNSLIDYHFNYFSNSSCLLYSASHSIVWLFSRGDSSNCNCPLLFAYQHGKLNRQSLDCLQSMSTHELTRQINQCQFESRKNICRNNLELFLDNNHSDENLPSTEFLLRQLYDRKYLTCSLNYSSFTSNIVIRSRLFNHFAIVLGIIFFLLIFLLILVIALLNGLQYKMREYDETWTWRNNMSWTTLRRTLSQTSLRRSRRDIRTIDRHGIISKSDNQLDRLKKEQDLDDDVDEQQQQFDHDLKQSQSITEDFQRQL